MATCPDIVENGKQNQVLRIREDISQLMKQHVLLQHNTVFVGIIY